MAVEKTAEYWLHRLRDADVGQWSDPGMCCVLSEFSDRLDDKPKAPNPAIELKKLGMAVLPQIIAHLDDTRPTRCKGHARRYRPESFYLLRYGDCCQQIFESVTGHLIYDRSSTNGYPLKDGKGKACKAAAERWWCDYKIKGEKQMLIEGVAAGVLDSGEKAHRLIDKYPEVALAAITQGSRRSKKAWVKLELFEAAKRLKEPAAVKFLRVQLKDSSRQVRAAACLELLMREKNEAIPAMLEEWKQAPLDELLDHDEESAVNVLVKCMVGSGDVRAIRAVATGLEKRPHYIRAEAVENCSLAYDLAGDALSSEARGAIEELLIKALSDDDSDIGDKAAEALSKGWGRPDLFDSSARFGTRRRQRLAVKNEWLRKVGKEPEVVPPLPKIDPAPEDQVHPLLDALLASEPADKRQVSLQCLEDLGLAAVPAITKALARTAPDHPSHGKLQALAGRLAFTLTQITFADPSVTPSDELRRRIETMRGHPVDSEKMMGLLTLLLKNLPAGTRGIDIALERVGNDTGATLTIVLLPDRPSRKGLSPQRGMSQTVCLDGKELMSRFSALAGKNQEMKLFGFDWSDFAEALRKGFKANPEQYLFVHVRCKHAR